MSWIGLVLGMHQRKPGGAGNVSKFKHLETPARSQLYLGELKNTLSSKNGCYHWV
jgi:hypothetical protein